MATQIYKVSDPSGKVREIEGPAGASDEEIITQAKKLFASAPAETKMPRTISGAMRRMREPGYTPPVEQYAKSPAELGRQYADVAKATGAELGKLVTGAGELLPGAAGEAAARGTQYLTGVAEQAGARTPGAGPFAKGVSIAAPIPGVTKYLQAAKSLPQLLRRGTGTGAAIGAATPTGSPDIAEKALPTAAGVALGTIPAIPGAVRSAREAVSGISKRVEPIGTPEGLTSLGERIQKEITPSVEKAYKARANEADVNYDVAKQTARESQTKGQPFAQSPAGRALLDTLQKSKYSIDEKGNLFLVGEDKVKAIDRLINAISGKTSGGFQRVAKETPAGKKIYSMKGEPKSTIEKDIDAVVEELRYLREANKPGNEFTGYAGLDARYRQQLEELLSKHLYAWNKDYEIADLAYREASKKLAPFQTQLMQKILRKEKYSPGELALDTERFADELFKSRDTVREFKAITGQPEVINNIAKNYFATIMEGKSPQRIQSFVNDPYQRGWMEESGIYDIAKRYAETVDKVESKREILKKLGLATTGGVVGSKIASILGLI